MPPYGGSIAQNVYYADSALCDSNEEQKGFPVRDVDAATGKMKPWPSPFILMVDRGACTFVQKVKEHKNICSQSRAFLFFNHSHQTKTLLIF
jgi:hypothetical protein